MLFRRKPRNRRLGREHVLDVKLRANKVRAARIRMAAVGLGAIFTVVLSVYLLWRAGDWALDRLVYQNDAFAITEVDVQTDGIIAVDQLRRWAGVRTGENLIAVDHMRVRRDLEMMPRVQFAAVDKILPHTLRIRVIERDPIARINIPQPRVGGGVEIATFLVDPEGWTMTPLVPSHRAAPQLETEDQLPILSGILANEVQTARRLEAARVQAALKLILAFERSPMAGLVDLQRIDVSSPEVLVATTGQGAEVTFRLTELDHQLLRWREVHDVAQKTGKAIAFLDLAVTNNVPVRWLEASVVPTSPPKLPKISKPRKKHV